MYEQFKGWDVFNVGDPLPILDPEKTEDLSFIDSGGQDPSIVLSGLLGPKIFQYDYSFLYKFRDFILPITTELHSTYSPRNRRDAYTPLDPSDGHQINHEVDYDPQKRPLAYVNEIGVVQRNPLFLTFEVSTLKLAALYPEFVEKDHLNFTSNFLEILKGLRVRLAIPEVAPLKNTSDRVSSVPAHTMIGLSQSETGCAISRFYPAALGPMPSASTREPARSLFLHLPNNLEKVSSIEASFYIMGDSEIEAEGIYKLR